MKLCGKRPHTIHDIQYHFVWVSKYRYHTLKGDTELRMRELSVRSVKRGILQL